MLTASSSRAAQRLRNFFTIAKWRWGLQAATCTLLTSPLATIPSINLLFYGNAMWIVQASVMVLENTTGATLKKALERLVGTIAGGLIALLIVSLIIPEREEAGKGTHPVFVTTFLLCYILLIPFLWGFVRTKFPNNMLIGVYALITSNLVSVGAYLGSGTIRIALVRIAAVMLGVLINTCVIHFVAPNKASDQIVAKVTSALTIMSDMLKLLVESEAGFDPEAEDVVRLNKLAIQEMTNRYMNRAKPSGSIVAEKPQETFEKLAQFSHSGVFKVRFKSRVEYAQSDHQGDSVADDRSYRGGDAQSVILDPSWATPLKRPLSNDLTFEILPDPSYGNPSQFQTKCRHFNSVLHCCRLRRSPTTNAETFPWHRSIGPSDPVSMDDLSQPAKPSAKRRFSESKLAKLSCKKSVLSRPKRDGSANPTVGRISEPTPGGFKFNNPPCNDNVSEMHHFDLDNDNDLLISYPINPVSGTEMSSGPRRFTRPSDYQPSSTHESRTPTKALSKKTVEEDFEPNKYTSFSPHNLNPKLQKQISYILESPLHVSHTGSNEFDIVRTMSNMSQLSAQFNPIKVQKDIDQSKNLQELALEYIERIFKIETRRRQNYRKTFQKMEKVQELMAALPNLIIATRQEVHVFSKKRFTSVKQLETLYTTLQHLFSQVASLNFSVDSQLTQVSHAKLESLCEFVKSTARSANVQKRFFTKVQQHMTMLESQERMQSFLEPPTEAPESRWRLFWLKKPHTGTVRGRAEVQPLALSDQKEPDPTVTHDPYILKKLFAGITGTLLFTHVFGSVMSKALEHIQIALLSMAQSFNDVGRLSNAKNAIDAAAEAITILVTMRNERTQAFAQIFDAASACEIAQVWGHSSTHNEEKTDPIFPWEALLGIDPLTLSLMSENELDLFWQSYWKARDRLSVTVGSLMILRDQLNILKDVLAELLPSDQKSH